MSKKDSSKKKRRYSSHSESSDSSHEKRKKKTKKIKEDSSLQDNVKMISEYRKILEQKNNQAQFQQQMPSMAQGMTQINPYFPAFQPLNMPPKAPIQPQVVIQNPKYTANKSHKEYQPFYIPAPLDNLVQKSEKNEIKRENLDQIIVFKKNFQEILPQGVQIFNELQLSCEKADPNLLIQIGKRYLQEFEKIFKDLKGFEKKRSQISKTLKGVQEVIKKLKDIKKQKQLPEDEPVKFDLLSELDQGLSMELASHFIDFSTYNLTTQNKYNIVNETEEGKTLFNSCLSLIE